MSWEEDYLMRRVGELTAALKGAKVLDECARCTTLFAAGLAKCPNCAHPAGEPSEQGSPVPESTAAGAALTGGVAAASQGRVPHDGSDPVPGQVDDGDIPPTGDGDQDDQGGDTMPDPNAPQETINGEPGSYRETNVEQLRAEVKRRKDLFVPSNANKPTLVAALRKHDKDRAERES